MPTLLLGRHTVESLLDIRQVMKIVERAFIAHARHEDQMPPKLYLQLPQCGGDFRAMPAYVDGAAGIKWVNSHAENPQRYQLPTVMAVMIYSDPETGYPLAIMDGTLITRFRTGAAAGLATRLFARPGARTLGMVGCGAQAYTALAAVSTVFTPEQVILSDARAEAVSSLAEGFPALPCRPGSIEEAAGCDVICTTTPVHRPIVRREWVQDGAHINALGADAAGKQELETDLTIQARVFVDDLEQASHSGEINVPIAQGLFRVDDLAGTIGEVAAGLLEGRVGNEITIFDSTGLAIQDVATAKHVYEAARERRIGQLIDLVS